MSKKTLKPRESKEVTVAKIALIGTAVTAVLSLVGVVTAALIQRSPAPTAQPFPTVQSTRVLQPSPISSPQYDMPPRVSEASFGTESVIDVLSNYAEALYAADLDNDGDLDVVSASTWNNEIAWYENDGGRLPDFTKHDINIVTHGTTSVHVADVNEDGYLDILASSYDGKIVWYENDGGLPPVFAGLLIAANADGARSVYAVDVDGDGDMDVLSASELDDKVAWYENDGGSPSTFTPHIIANNANTANSVYAADLDGDGDVDVLSSSRGDNKVAWYQNDGGLPPAFARHFITTDANGARWVYAADIDGDGDMDVLSSAEYDNKVTWYENEGGLSPGFTEHVITTTADFAHSIYAADIDNDGDVDILSSSWDDDKVTWYENDGDVPPTFTSHFIATIADPSVYAADLDGDGDLDILSASYSGGRVVWYENQGR